MDTKKFMIKQGFILGQFSAHAQNFNTPEQWCNELHQLWAQAESDYQQLENDRTQK